MSRTNDELEAKYKVGLPASHAQGLREVYQLGRTDEQEALQGHVKHIEARLGNVTQEHFTAQARVAELEASLAGLSQALSADAHQKNLDEVRRMASAGEPLIPMPPSEGTVTPAVENPPAAVPSPSPSVQAQHGEGPAANFGGVAGAPTPAEQEKASEAPQDPQPPAAV